MQFKSSLKYAEILILFFCLFVCLLACFWFCETGYLCVTVLAALEVALIDQADLKDTEIHLPLPLSAGIKGVHQNHQA